MNASSLYRRGAGFILFTVMVVLNLAVGCDGPISALADNGDPNSVNDSGNQRPVAKAGGDLTAFGGARVAVDGGESSDPDGDPVTFRWSVETAGEQPGISDPTGAQAMIDLPNVEIETTYRLKLTVSDGSLSAEDELDIHVTPFVTPASSVLAANPGPDLTATAGTVVVLDGSQSVIGIVEETRIQWMQTFGTRLTIEDGDKLIAWFFAPAVAVETEFQFRLLLTQGTQTSASTASIVVQPSGLGKAGNSPP